ncbi:hypothetical protein [Paracoccus zhejiangensis]|uniref:Uncharacterized protein n=1 Tax=Paracoccus zhejiangensis TaxID=1077935 RepID=A0A2H5EWR7_9RHOB|nr:hypothetical protein [Paracoccus zhejiangensis]AUH63714.1 hypothetical protein CX676_05690 [Paracoccus zhejiangensis]
MRICANAERNFDPGLSTGTAHAEDLCAKLTKSDFLRNLALPEILRMRAVTIMQGISTVR